MSTPYEFSFAGITARIPASEVAVLQRFVQHGEIPQSSFLQYVLANRLRQAAQAASPMQAFNFLAYAAWTYCEAPAIAVADQLAVQAWAAAGGSAGIAARAAAVREWAAS